MEAKATARFVRMSPRKLRRVASLIRGRDYENARNILSYTPKAAAQTLINTMKSAASNAISKEGSAKVKIENLFVKEVWIDGGPTLKRIRAVGMGRAYRIRKKTAHINIVLAEKEIPVKITPEPVKKSAEKVKEA
jgi:large subunit ribosomal protein L22